MPVRGGCVPMPVLAHCVPLPYVRATDMERVPATQPESSRRQGSNGIAWEILHEFVVSRQELTAFSCSERDKNAICDGDSSGG